MAIRTLNGLLALAGVSIALSGCTGRTYDSAVIVDARPGTVALVPYDQPVDGKPPTVFGWLDAYPTTEPARLPEGAQVLHDSMNLHSSGDVSGHLLIHVPEQATGEIEFLLSAWSRGEGISTRAASRYTSREVPVTIHIAGSSVDVREPSLEGQWRSDNGTWTFARDDVPMLHIQTNDGDEQWLRYRLYPESDGRWYLISMSHTNAAFWIQVDDSRLSVDWPGTDFNPFSTYERL